MCEVMEKNHDHIEHPQEDHVDDFSEEETQKAFDFYVGADKLKELQVATSADIQNAWGAVDQALLDAMNLVALNTQDKAALEAFEAKMKLKADKLKEREAFKKKLPFKHTGVNMAKIIRQKPHRDCPIMSGAVCIRNPPMVTPVTSLVPFLSLCALCSEQHQYMLFQLDRLVNILVYTNSGPSHGCFMVKQIIIISERHLHPLLL